MKVRRGKLFYLNLYHVMRQIQEPELLIVNVTKSMINSCEEIVRQI